MSWHGKTLVQGDYLHTEEAAFESALGEIDLRALQLAFSHLFDRATEVVQRLGLDQDEVVLDRVIVCRTTDGLHEAPANWLAHKDRLLADVRLHLNQASCHTSPDSPDMTPCLDARVIRLKVMVRHDPLPTRHFPCAE